MIIERIVDGVIFDGNFSNSLSTNDNFFFLCCVFSCLTSSATGSKISFY